MNRLGFRLSNSMVLLRIRRWFRTNLRSSAESVDLHFLDHYDDWSKKRFAYVAQLLGKVDFTQVSILEISAGHANLGRYFLGLGSSVTCTDGRPEHTEWIRHHYPNVNTMVVNLDNKFPSLPKFDVVLHLGVLYHLLDPLKHLNDFLTTQDFDHLFLESEVCNSSDPNTVLRIKESGYDQGLFDRGGRPSSYAIEKVLSEFDLNWKRHDSDRLNSGVHCYDWKESNTSEVFRVGMRRFYHIRKNPA